MNQLRELIHHACNVKNDVRSVVNVSGAGRKPSLTSRTHLINQLPPCASFDVTLPEMQLRKFGPAQTSVVIKQRLRPNFLILDDNRIVALACKSLCEKMNCRATAVFTPVEALQKLEEEAYDAIVVDLHMPGQLEGPPGARGGMDGIEFTRRVRDVERAGAAGNNIHIPIFLTLSLEDDNAQVCSRALAAGCDRYILKPTIYQLSRICKMFIVGGNCSEKFRLRVEEEGLFSHFSEMVQVFDTEFLDKDEMRDYIELLKRERKEQEENARSVSVRLGDRIKKLEAQLVKEQARTARPKTPIEVKIAVATERYRASCGRVDESVENKKLQKHIQSLEEMVEQYRGNIKELVANAPASKAPQQEEKKVKPEEGMGSVCTVCPLGSRELYETICMEYEDFSASRLWHNYTLSRSLADLTPSLGRSWFHAEIIKMRDYVSKTFFEKYFTCVETSFAFLRQRVSTVRDESFRVAFTEVVQGLVTEVDHQQEVARTEILGLINCMVKREFALWKNVVEGRSEAIIQCVPQIMRPEAYKVTTMSRLVQTDDFTPPPPPPPPPPEEDDLTFLTSLGIPGITGITAARSAASSLGAASSQGGLSTQLGKEIVRLKDEMKKATQSLQNRTIGMGHAMKALAGEKAWPVDKLVEPPSYSTPEDDMSRVCNKYLTSCAEALKEWAQIRPPSPPPPPLLVDASTQDEPEPEPEPEPFVCAFCGRHQTSVVDRNSDRAKTVSRGKSTRANNSLNNTLSSRGRRRESRKSTDEADADDDADCDVNDNFAMNTAEALLNRTATQRRESWAASVAEIPPYRASKDEMRALASLTAKVDNLALQLVDDQPPTVALDLMHARQDRAYVMTLNMLKSNQRSNILVHVTTEKETLKKISEAYLCDMGTLLELNATYTPTEVFESGKDVHVAVTAEQIKHICNIVHRRYILPCSDLWRRNVVKKSSSKEIDFTLDDLRRISTWYVKQKLELPMDRIICCVLSRIIFVPHGMFTLEVPVHPQYTASTLRTVGSHYLVDPEEIKAANGLLATKLDGVLKGIDTLQIPVEAKSLEAALAFVQQDRKAHPENSVTRHLSSNERAIVARCLNLELDKLRDRSTLMINVGHIVEHGESVRAIARHHGTTADAIYAANPNIKKDEFKPGVPLDARRFVGIIVPVSIDYLLNNAQNEKNTNTDKLILSFNLKDSDLSLIVTQNRRTIRASLATDNVVCDILEIARTGAKLPLILQVEHNYLPQEDVRDIAVAYDVPLSAVSKHPKEDGVLVVDVKMLAFYERICQQRNKSAAAIYDITGPRSKRGFGLMKKEDEDQLSSNKCELSRLQALCTYMEQNMSLRVTYIRNSVIEEAIVLRRALSVHSLVDHILRALPPSLIHKILLSLRQTCKDEEWYIFRSILLSSSRSHLLQMFPVQGQAAPPMHQPEDQVDANRQHYDPSGFHLPNIFTKQPLTTAPSVPPAPRQQNSKVLPFSPPKPFEDRSALHQNYPQGLSPTKPVEGRIQETQSFRGRQQQPLPPSTSSGSLWGSTSGKGMRPSSKGVPTEELSLRDPTRETKPFIPLRPAESFLKSR